MYVYRQTEPNLWTVGYYDLQGHWHPDSDHATQEEAAKRVAWLNGSENYDFGDAAQNPYILTGKELERAERAAT